MTDVAAMAAATPATRDRYVDFLRVASLAGVILGHFLMAVVDDRPEATGGHSFVFTNILALAPWTRPATWVLQVMPIFFVVGGFAHATAWRSLARRGGGYADFARARVARLVWPALVFVSRRDGRGRDRRGGPGHGHQVLARAAHRGPDCCGSSGST